MAVAPGTGQRTDDGSERRQTGEGVGGARADDQLCEGHRTDRADALHTLDGVCNFLVVCRMHGRFELTARRGHLVGLGLDFSEYLSESRYCLELSNPLDVVPIQVPDTRDGDSGVQSQSPWRWRPLQVERR